MVKSGDLYYCKLCDKLIGHDPECQTCFTEGIKMGWMVTNA